MPNKKIVHFNERQYVVDLKETLKALKKGQVTSLIITQDVEVHLPTRILSYISHKNISVSFFSSQRALGEYVGININATIVTLIGGN